MVVWNHSFIFIAGEMMKFSEHIFPKRVGWNHPLNHHSSHWCFHLEGSSIGRRWSRHGTMLHQLSQRVRGAQFLCGEKIRAFLMNFFDPTHVVGSLWNNKNALQVVFWPSKSSWTNVMSWLNQWVCKMQWLGSCQVGCFSLYVTLFFKKDYLHLHLSMVDLQIRSEDLSIRSWMKDHREVLEEFWTTPELVCWKHTFMHDLCILSSLRHYYLP